MAEILSCSKFGWKSTDDCLQQAFFYYRLHTATIKEPTNKNLFQYSTSYWDTNNVADLVQNPFLTYTKKLWELSQNNYNVFCSTLGGCFAPKSDF